MGFDILIGRGFDTSCVRVRYTMVRVFELYMGKGGQNTIDKWFDIPWIGGSIKHG